jgi:response regulator RpfG family c-di-GMP phosphodiesterase
MTVSMALAIGQPHTYSLRSVEAALMELRANSGKQFDPELVEIFIVAMAAEQGKQAA